MTSGIFPGIAAGLCNQRGDLGTAQRAPEPVWPTLSRECRRAAARLTARAAMRDSLRAVDEPEAAVTDGTCRSQLVVSCRVQKPDGRRGRPPLALEDNQRDNLGVIVHNADPSVGDSANR